jgi:CRISPR/Cas system CSM-associated protein Csm3 (group 7 of RAMP superfamily)
MPEPAIRPATEYRFVLQCRTTGPLRVGSGMMSELTDAEPRRRADGQLIIPGTSIAGALRGAVERLIFKPDSTEPKCLLYTQGTIQPNAKEPCKCAVCRLFGNVVPVDDAMASKVWVHDVCLPLDAVVRIVDGVAIDRSRRSAADARKYDYVEIRPGVTFWIDVRAEHRADIDPLTEKEKEWLGAALCLLATGEIPLGGHAARGAGRLECLAATIRSRDLRDPEQLLAATIRDELDATQLDAEADDPVWPGREAARLDEFPGRSLAFGDRISITFRLAPDGRHGETYLVSDPVEALLSGYDRAPRGGPKAAELPAASLRGALRSGAERILRTIADHAKLRPSICDPSSSSCRCPIDPATGRKRQDESWCCLACRVFGNVDLASRLAVSVRMEDVRSRPAPFDHLAIDRFTGGSRDRLKFDAMAALGGSFHVTLTLDRLSKDDTSWMLGLLALMLQDLHQGRITVGHGASKGHGVFRISDWGEDWSKLIPGGLDAAVRALWKKLERAFPEAKSGAVS